MTKQAAGNQVTKPLQCPGCSSKRFAPEGKVWSCKRCGGLVAEHVYFGDSLALVSNQFDENASLDGSRYFDLSGVGSDGPYRRHGWFNPTTKRIVQVG